MKTKDWQSMWFQDQDFLGILEYVWGTLTSLAPMKIASRLYFQYLKSEFTTFIDFFQWTELPAIELLVQLHPDKFPKKKDQSRDQQYLEYVLETV